MRLASRVHLARHRRLSLALIALASLGALASLLALRAARGGRPGGAASWTIQAEHVTEVREAAPWLGPGRMAVTRSTIQIWFAPGRGWRMAVESAGDYGARQRVFGSDGMTAWNYDPTTNRYTLAPANAAGMDPRASLAVMMATAGASDFDATVAALRRIPNLSVTVERDDTVVGRATTVVLMTPFSCSESVQRSSSGEETRERQCGGFTRVWLDRATGWMLRGDADDGRAGGFLWETQSLVVDGVLDSALWRFTPPAGSLRVDTLD